MSSKGEKKEYTRGELLKITGYDVRNLSVAVHMMKSNRLTPEKRLVINYDPKEKIYRIAK